MTTLTGEEGAGLYASRAFVCFFCTCLFLSFLYSSWCRGLAAVCDCGTPRTFQLAFFFTYFCHKQVVNTAVHFLALIKVLRSQPGKHAKHWK